MVRELILASGSAPPVSGVIFLVVLVVLVPAITIPVHIAKKRRRARPVALQAQEVGAHFNGQPTVTYYPTYTALSEDQIRSIAWQRGYVQVEEGATYRGNRFLVFRR